MPQLRWALIGLSLAFLLALALWEWRRTSRQPRRGSRPEPFAPDVTLVRERPRRVEPGLGEVPGVLVSGPGDVLDVPTILPRELPVANESAVDVPSVARGSGSDEPLADAQGPDGLEPDALEPDASESDASESGLSGSSAPVAAPPQAGPPPVHVRWPPENVDRVLTLRIVKSGGAMLPGRPLRIALEAAGLSSGPQQIFHRADPHGAVVVSAANLVQPGILDPVHMDASEYRGLSLFSVLPGPLPPVRMLEELVATARSVAHRLGAIVEDEHGAGLDGLRLAELRRSLPEGGGNAGGRS
jgi:FtsZ-interacting cell division protein ZipA